MARTILKAMLAGIALAGASSAQADRVAVPHIVETGAPEMPAPTSVSIEVVSAGDRLWTGTLRIGPDRNNAYFNQSRSQYSEPCPGDAQNSRNSSFSENLRVSIARYDWRRVQDQFNVNVNVVRPAPACEGGGNDTIGLNRFVTLPSGGSVTIEGEGGLVVRLTRGR